MLLLKDQHQESEWWSFTQHITPRMEWDIKEICLRHTPTHAQRLNQCPISILYTGFYNPVQFIKQQTQQGTVKNGNRKKDFITLCIAHFGGRNTPTARVLENALNHQWFDLAKWPMAPLGWKMCSSLGWILCLSSTAAQPVLAHRKKSCCCIKLFLFVIERFQTRENGNEGDRKERRLRQCWSLICKVMTKLLPFSHHVFIS